MPYEGTGESGPKTGTILTGATTCFLKEQNTYEQEYNCANMHH